MPTFIKKRDSSWYLNVANAVISKIRVSFDKKAKLVENVAPDTLASFPCIFYTQLNPVETGRDLNNNEINAIDCTVEVRGYVNTGDYEDCKKLLRPVINGFKAYRFNVTMFPVYTKTNNVVSGVVRFRRIVGADDKDITYIAVKVSD